MKRSLCSIAIFFAATMPTLSQSLSGGAATTNEATAVSTAGVVESADGVPIHFTSIGDGETALVFVHGWTLNRTFWNEQVGHFANSYRLVALDLAGHGKSGKDRTRWTMAAFGEDVVSVVNELALERVILIGHSMGGRVVVEAAQRLGARVSALVFVDSFFDPEEKMPTEQRQQIVSLYRIDFPANVGSMVRQYLFTATADSLLKERIANHMASFDPEIGVASIEELFQSDYKDLIRKLDVPKIAINADQYPTHFERMHDYGVKPYIMEGVGHFLMVEDPTTFNQILDEALRDIVEN